MLRFDLNNENETIRNYRARVRQCEQLGEFALAEQIRQSSSRSKTIKSIWRPPWATTSSRPPNFTSAVRLAAVVRWRT